MSLCSHPEMHLFSQAHTRAKLSTSISVLNYSLHGTYAHSLKYVPTSIKIFKLLVPINIRDYQSYIPKSTSIAHPPLG